MITEIGKYYIVSENGKLILDLGLQENSVHLKTTKQVDVFDTEQDYNDFKNTLEKEFEDDWQ